MPDPCPLDIHFVPVPDRVLAELLRLAAVRADDLVYDLGCGDGRIILAAVRTCGARGVGVDLDPARIVESQAHASRAGATDRAIFRQEDLFHTDLRPATVLALYLTDSLNVRLRPRILAQCRPGTRIVTYSFEMGAWECDTHTPMAANGVSLWIVPANFAGAWEPLAPPDSTAADSAAPRLRLTLRQTYQKLTGTAEFTSRADAPADTALELREGRISGTHFTARCGPWSLTGRIEDDRLEGQIQDGNATFPWSARRTGPAPAIETP